MIKIFAVGSVVRINLLLERFLYTWCIQTPSEILSRFFRFYQQN